MKPNPRVVPEKVVRNVVPGKAVRRNVSSRRTVVSSDTWETTGILDCEFKPSLNETRFKVQWCVDGVVSTSWEPIECLAEVPLLMYKFEQKAMNKWIKECMRSGGKVVGLRPPIHPKAYTNHHAGEFQPNGRQSVKKILRRLTNRSDDVFVVKFHNISGEKIVKKCVMDYYYPIDVISFLKQAQC